MFSSPTSLTNPTGSDWGERLLNTVGSKTIKCIFTQSESVEVFIHCHPANKLLQGSIDGCVKNLLRTENSLKKELIMRPLQRFQL